MHLRQINSLLSLTALLTFGLVNAGAQTPDTSGNGLLKGSYQFRHVAVTNLDANYDPAEIVASYGTITFDGAGNYSITGTTVDNTVSSGAPKAMNVTGTYAIGSSGAGYVANPLYPTNYNTYLYGAVAQGVFAGSSTESSLDPVLYPINDTFIAIPTSSAPTNAGFTSAYQTGLLDFTGASASTVRNALFKLSPDGKGGFGTISVNGQAADQSAATLAQSIAGAKYNFGSDGSATLTIPLPTGVTSSTNALFTGSKTMYQSTDGNFILGWTAGGYDVFFGVKALAVTGTNSLSAGLYFTTALESFPGVQGGSGTDSFYGGTNNVGNGNGDGIIHERLNYPGITAFSYDYGTDDQITLNADGTTPVDLNGYQYIFGDGGQAFVAIGSSGRFSLQVGLHAASFSGAGVYLNPTGVVNAANFQPVTASIAPGEMIVLFGTGLASTTLSAPGAQTLPTTLGGVTVTINGILCPIFYVTPGQLAVDVPYAVAANQTGLANIQVTNNKVQSNVVQVYLTDAAPGAFASNSNGIGYAAATHAATGQVITQSNPVVAGEFISLYVAGLGTVTPTVADGALGPWTVPLSYSDVYNAGNLSVYFNDYTNGTTFNAGAIQFAGLAPYFAGLYQINVQVPSSGLVSGDNVYVEFITDAADVNQIQIPFGAGTTAPLARTGAKVAAAVQTPNLRTGTARIRATRPSANQATPPRIVRRPLAVVPGN